MTQTTPTPARPARRSVVKGAAWAVPAVTLATAAPAVAASPGCISVLGASACRDDFLFWATYTFGVDFRNNCGDDATIVATITAQTDYGPVTVTRTLTLTPGAAGRASGEYTRFLDYDDFPSSISVSFTVDGLAAPGQTIPAPPCTPAPTGAQVHHSGTSIPETPSDEEVRAHLRSNPHLMDQPEVQDLLRSHPEWDPRTTSRDESTETESPTSSPEPEATPEAPPADDAGTEGTEPAETEEPPADADTSEVTSSPNE